MTSVKVSQNIDLIAALSTLIPGSKIGKVYKEGEKYNVELIYPENKEKELKMYEKLFFDKKLKANIIIYTDQRNFILSVIKNK